MCISVRNVTKRFGSFVALGDVSIDIPTGSLTALLGPSGGGKTTLLRVIAGLETPDAGVVDIAGTDSTRLPPQRRNVGFVFQHYAAFKHMTVFKNVAFGLSIRKRPRAEIRKRGTERAHRASRRPVPGSALGRAAPTHGTRARACGRARGASARRAFGALDAQVRKELRAWLRRLHDQVHVTTAFVTHDQEEAIDVANVIVVIANGKIEQTGTPDELYDKPASDFVMSFLGPVTRLQGRLVRPHDLEIVTSPTADSVPGHVVRVVRLGFEVRVDVATDDGEVWVQLTRGDADRLAVSPGASVAVRVVHESAITPGTRHHTRLTLLHPSHPLTCLVRRGSGGNRCAPRVLRLERCDPQNVGVVAKVVARPSGPSDNDRGNRASCARRPARPASCRRRRRCRASGRTV